MIARLTDGPVVPQGEPHYDIWQVVLDDPMPRIRMALTEPSHRSGTHYEAQWIRLYEDSPPWPHGNEAWYRLVSPEPVGSLDNEDVFHYTLEKILEPGGVRRDQVEADAFNDFYDLEGEIRVDRRE
jgi:hypothetical protein